MPLNAIAGAVVRRRWLFAPTLILTARDLNTFEGLAGSDGLALDHPAELRLGLTRSNRLAAEEFSAELELAVAQAVAAVTGEKSGARLHPGEPPSTTSPDPSHPDQNRDNHAED